MADEELMPTFPVARFQAEGKSGVNFGIKRIVETGQKRVIARERPYRPGAKHDDTGPKAIGWEIESVFHNRHEEEGISEAHYPDDVDELLNEHFPINACGNLWLPTKGPVRARFLYYQRIEDADLRDAAVVRMIFAQDNEDDATQQSFATVSAKSIARSTAEEATFELEQAGADSFDVSQLNELASGLEGLANAPGQFVDDIDTKANAMVHACERVEDAFTQASNRATHEVATLLTQPQNSQAGRLLSKLRDSSKRVVTEVGGVGGLRTVTYPRVVSIFDVAVDVGQEASRLLAVNPGIRANPMRIAARTPISVFAS